jgi:hypothetical protein
MNPAIFFPPLKGLADLLPAGCGSDGSEQASAFVEELLP